MAKGIAFAFAAAGVCLTSFATGQTQAPVQTSNAPTLSIPIEPVQATVRGNSEHDRHVPALPALHQRIDVVLNETTLRAAFGMLSKQIKLPIDVDPRVKSTVTVTAEATNVPVYHVLEMIVHQPGTGMLMISPKAGGILIEPYPTREVNGKQTMIMGSNPPWSDAWYPKSTIAAVASPTFTTQSISPASNGASSLAVTETPILAPASQSGVPTVNPAVATPFGQSTPSFEQPSRLDSTQAGPPTAPLAGAPTPQVNPGYPPIIWTEPTQGIYGPPGFELNGSLSVMVTALSDKSFVVTEPGLGPKNEVGVYLTVYRIEGVGTKAGESLREVSRVFHRSANGGRSFATPLPPAAMPGGRSGIQRGGFIPRGLTGSAGSGYGGG